MSHQWPVLEAVWMSERKDTPGEEVWHWSQTTGTPVWRSAVSRKGEIISYQKTSLMMYAWISAIVSILSCTKIYREKEREARAEWGELFSVINPRNVYEPPPCFRALHGSSTLRELRLLRLRVNMKVTQSHTQNSPTRTHRVHKHTHTHVYRTSACLQPSHFKHNSASMFNKVAVVQNMFQRLHAVTAGGCTLHFLISAY